MRVCLDDRYLLEQGVVYLNGLHALVRLPIDQHRRDQRAGLHTATFISGYPGSPLGGYDLALQQAQSILEQHRILHVPGANEELAATAISGTQMLDNYSHSHVDGVVSFWYGKGPGVDRSGDAFKHGNFAGTSKHGAVVVLSGDDHEAKSSTMPFQDDYAFMSAGIPIVYPASTGEFLTLGLHAIAMSRYSGCWVAMKLVNALADGGETVDVSPDSPSIAIPELAIDGRPFKKATDFRFFPGLNVETERQLYYERHPAAIAYARANHLDRIVVSTPNDHIGIITAGKSYADTRGALADMGVDDETLRRRGIRILCMGLIYPIDGELVREFARNLDEIIVIEEKRGFLEAQVKEALCGLHRGVRVVGKFDEARNPLFPIQGGMDSDLLVERLGPRLLNYLPDHQGILARLAQLKVVHSRAYSVHSGRTPNYCSGCPHNISTKLLEGQVAWGSPGCHSFASIIEEPNRHIVSMTQLGGEGLPWVGLSPFTDKPHMVQNVGDGSLFHSSYLNIRFCVAAGVNITFKILYNGFAANTGGQSMVGGKPIPELTRMLELEGVKRIAIVSQDPDKYRTAHLASNAKVYPVEKQDEVLAEMEKEPGVTIYIYDGLCANERRRQQKRGKFAIPNKFVVINREVCEGCGHCGALTNCMSLHRIETEFGQKTEIHTSSCNQDYSCLGGDCPSFVTVETRKGAGYRRPVPPHLESVEIEEPRNRIVLDRPYHIYIPGVGGTGIITINALLCYAALIDGKFALSYDQTGAAQKWGPVLSSLVVAPNADSLTTNKVGAAHADLYLACDVLAGAQPVNLDRCDPDFTAAIVNTTLLPTGEMIRNVNISYPTDALIDKIDQYTNRSIHVEARRFAEGLFGDYMATNMFVLGVAYQSGLMPMNSSSIEAAIELNRIQVKQNLQAFRYGRLFVADPARVHALVDTPARNAAQEAERMRSHLGRAQVNAYTSLLASCDKLDEESRRLLAIRIGELIEYQDQSYARLFVDFVLSVAAREQTAMGKRSEITHAVIRYLYKLMAYKDEYEVARLHLKPSFLAETQTLFAEPIRVVYNLHPPLLRQFGLKRKLQFGPWFTPALRLLSAMRGLRGTPFDIFGFAHIRRQERSLNGWYKELVAAALDHLDAETYSSIVRIASLPDQIRGYEEIKMRNVETVKEQARKMAVALKTGNTTDMDQPLRVV